MGRKLEGEEDDLDLGIGVTKESEGKIPEDKEELKISDSGREMD